MKRRSSGFAWRTLPAIPPRSPSAASPTVRPERVWKIALAKALPPMTVSRRPYHPSRPPRSLGLSSGPSQTRRVLSRVGRARGEPSAALLPRSRITRGTAIVLESEPGRDSARKVLLQGCSGFAGRGPGPVSRFGFPGCCSRPSPRSSRASSQRSCSITCQAESSLSLTLPGPESLKDFTRYSFADHRRSEFPAP
jgi:hypothetical protein